MPSAGFKPAIPETEWLQTYAFDCAATGIGLQAYYLHVHPVINFKFLLNQEEQSYFTVTVKFQTVLQ